MAQPADREGFRERIRDVIYHKEELENHLQNALQTARSKEDLVKLNVTVVKLEKLLSSVKGDIDRRIGPQQQGLSSIGVFTTHSPPVSGQEKQPNFFPVQPKAAAPISPFKPVAPYQVERPKEAQTTTTTRVFSNSAAHSDNGWATFRKNPNIPNNHRVYIPRVSFSTTEESLYKYFSDFGKVWDVKLFTYLDGRQNSAAVGFDNPQTAQKVLRQELIIDGFATFARAYFNKEDNPKARFSQIKLKRYQVFCGGIPVKATSDDIKKALEDNYTVGKVRDVRVVYPRDTKDKTVHRGFAFIDIERDDDAQWLVSKQRPIYIFNKEVDCKPNSRPLEDDVSLSGSLSDLTGLDESKDYALEDTAKKSPTSETPKSDRSNGAMAAPKVTNCTVCKKNPQNCVLLWCGHTETCDECGNKLKNCPKVGCGEKVEMCTKL